MSFQSAYSFSSSPNDRTADVAARRTNLANSRGQPGSGSSFAGGQTLTVQSVDKQTPDHRW